MPRTQLKTERVPIDEVRPLDRNPRRGDIDFIRESLRRFGQYVPVVVRAETSEILKGNHTWHALKAEDATHVEVIRRSVPDDDEARRLAIADNRASDLSDWDLELLTDQLVALPDLEATGYDRRELDQLIATAAAIRTPGPDDVADPPAPERPKRPKTKVGDLIRLGDHRLVCGDCRDPKVVAQALSDGKIEPLLLVTDPPYGVEFDPAWRDRAGYNGERFRGAKDDKRVAKAGVAPSHPAEPSYVARPGVSDATKGDKIDDWSDAFELVGSLAVAYVWHADRFTDTVLAGLERIGFERVQMIIWDKEIFVLSRSVYHWQHEPCWLARRRGAKIPFYGEQNQSTIIRAQSPKRIGAAADEGKWEHPTQKPLALYMPPISNHLLPGEWIYEPFAGSGTGLIAAEKLERRCAAIEVDPGYCDVIVERWEAETGKTAKRPRRQSGRNRKETQK